MSSARYHNVFPDGAVCFWTSAVVEHVPIFRSPTAATTVLAVLDECRTRCGVRVLGYVFMPDHIHLAVWSEQGQAVKRFIRQFLSIASARIAALAEQAASRGDPLASDWLGVFRRRARDGDAVRVWKERGRAFPVTREGGLLQKLNYIHNNPVRAGFAETPEEWDFSSASWYSSGHGPLQIDGFDW